MGGDDDSGGDKNGILVPDFLQANDWKFSRFATFVLTLQVIVLLLIFLDGYGLVPLYLRSLVTFLFYSYVPGLVLLRVLRIHRMGAVLTTLVSVSTSVVLMIFVGFMLNLFYLELSGPIPFVLPSLILGQTVMLLLLCGLAYLIDRRFDNEPLLDVSLFLSAPAFALYSLPLIAVLSTYLLNGWNEAFLQITLLLLVASVVLTLLVVRIPSQLYVVAVICISLAVVFHTSLVSRFVVEWADISFEYWSANSTLIHGYWDQMGDGSRTGTVLSITLLAPAYSIICGLDMNQVFKVCYPFLLALLPIGAFALTRRVLDERSALLSAFLIISGTVFFTEFLGLARQIVAELFLVAALVMIVNGTRASGCKLLIVWMLILGIELSHYGVLAIIMPSILLSSIFYLVMDRRKVTRLSVAKVIGTVSILVFPPILWYGFVSNSLVLDGIKNTILQLIDGTQGSAGLIDGFPRLLFFQDGMAPSLFAATSIVAVMALLSMYGLYWVLKDKGMKERWGARYLALAIPFTMMSLISLFDTNLFFFVSRERFIHICLLFTAPLIVVGGTYSLRAIDRNQHVMRKYRPSLVVLGTISVSLFLTNTGVIEFVAGEDTSIAFDNGTVERPRYSDGEFLAANFTFDRMGNSHMIYADANGAYLLGLMGGQYNPLYGRDAVTIPQDINVHYFLGSDNLARSIMLEDPSNPRLNMTYISMDYEFIRSIQLMDKVYASQEAELYFKKF